jgi:hypothetical protein
MAVDSDNGSARLQLSVSAVCQNRADQSSIATAQATKFSTEESGFDSWHKQDIFLFSEVQTGSETHPAS